MKTAVQIKRGDRVRIPKGTPIWWNGEAKYAGRSYVITVDHVLEGYALCPHSRQTNLCKHLTGDRSPKLPSAMPTTIRWAGAGGYWAECNIEAVELVGEF